LTTGLRASGGLHARVDRFLAVSEAVRAASRVGVGQPPRPIEVVPAFIPDDASEEAARVETPAYLPPRDSYILFVGALTVHKGLRVLLDAYADLAPRARLLLIGTSHGAPIGILPSGVTVVRDAPHAEVMAAWAGCAVGVVPSIWPDPCPLVAIEAMACGRARSWLRRWVGCPIWWPRARRASWYLPEMRRPCATPSSASYRTRRCASVWAWRRGSGRGASPFPR